MSFVLDPIRNIHKPVADCCRRSRPCPLLIAAALALARAIILIISITAAISLTAAVTPAAKAAIIAALVLAVGKLLIVHHNLCGVYLLAILIHITACLNPAAHEYTHSLTEILLRKFPGTVKGHDINEIRRLSLIAVLAPAPSPVHCQRIVRNRHRTLSLGVAHNRISC